jgi:hypothetical protein
MMGGRGSSSSCSATPTVGGDSASRLRPGCCFSGLRPHLRRQAAFLHEQSSSKVRSCSMQYASGIYCHWPEERSGLTQPSIQHGPCTGITCECHNICARPHRAVSVTSTARQGAAQRAIVWHASGAVRGAQAGGAQRARGRHRWEAARRASATPPRGRSGKAPPRPTER